MPDHEKTENAETLLYAGGPEPAETLPLMFGRFRLEKRLGKGSFGVVYEAFDTRHNLRVALKRAIGPDIAKQFETSFAVSIKVRHPHVCRVIEQGEIDGVPYLTMDICTGGSLRDKPRFRDPLEAVLLVHGLARTLSAVHEQDVIHLDLKPANILFNDLDEVIIVDFGLAIRRDLLSSEMLGDVKDIGTLPYMAPEQIYFRDATASVGPSTDVWGLGVILYELLTGQLPFQAVSHLDLAIAIRNHAPKPPSSFNPKVRPFLDKVCLTALSKNRDDRYRDMDAFAEQLLKAYDETEQKQRLRQPGYQRPLVPASCIRFLFAGYGVTAPEYVPPERLFLDVGGGLRPGVIDHHETAGGNASATRLVLDNPEYLDATVAADRDERSTYTILVHEQPDLDCVAAAFLAQTYLAAGRFPDGAVELADYVDDIDQGSQPNPASLYIGYQVVTNRLGKQRFPSVAALWTQQLRDGMKLIEAVLGEAARSRKTVGDVDALAAVDWLGEPARREVEEDRRRYLSKLGDVNCHARAGRIHLPNHDGATTPVDLLILRDAGNAHDRERCEMLKVWARLDAEHSASGKGFVALCVFLSEGPNFRRRCIISVTPDSAVTLEGFGELLERAEHQRRSADGQLDERETDPLSGEPLPVRAGYDNPDPWYDGRSHNYTIIDSPRSGTALSADEIELLLLDFGQGKVTMVASVAATVS